MLKQIGIEGGGCRSNHIQPYLTQKDFFLKKRQPRRAAISEKGVWMSFLHLRIQQGKCRIQNFPQTQCRKNAGWTEKIVTFRYQGFRVL